MSMDKEIDRAVAEVVDARIRQGVTEALGKDPETMVRAVVDAALSEKPGSYGRETFLQAAVKDLIQKAAQDSLRQWVVENQELIRARVAERIAGKKADLPDRIADSVIEALQKSVTVAVSMKVDPDW